LILAWAELVAADELIDQERQVAAMCTWRTGALLDPKRTPPGADPFLRSG